MLLLLISWTVMVGSSAQATMEIVRNNKQKAFKKTIPAGNYSGIAWLGDNKYAVVTDKSDHDGFFVLQIDIDSVTAKIHDARILGFYSSQLPNRDAEGIAYLPESETLLISGESGNDIIEYQMDGQLTGRKVYVPEIFHASTSNYGLESLSYNPSTRRLWTCSESTIPFDGPQASSTNRVMNRIRVQSFDASLHPLAQYAYQMDEPKAHKRSVNFAMGVSELCALDDGSLLVLEREFRVPKLKIGSYVINKIYQVFPDREETIESDKPLSDDSPYMTKYLLAKWRTRLNITARSIANYEGMCLGPRLTDGSQSIILVADSQNRYKGVLKDWLKTLIIKPVDNQQSNVNDY